MKAALLPMSALGHKRTSVSGLEHRQGTGLVRPVPFILDRARSLLKACQPT